MLKRPPPTETGPAQARKACLTSRVDRGCCSAATRTGLSRDISLTTVPAVAASADDNASGETADVSSASTNRRRLSPSVVSRVTLGLRGTGASLNAIRRHAADGKFIRTRLPDGDNDFAEFWRAMTAGSTCSTRDGGG